MILSSSLHAASLSFHWIGQAPMIDTLLPRVFCFFARRKIITYQIGCLNPNFLYFVQQEAVDLAETADESLTFPLIPISGVIASFT